jgi:hypothetical protein
MANDGKKNLLHINMPNTANGKTHINRVSLKWETKKREQYIIYLTNSVIYNILQGPRKEAEEKIIFFN